MIEPPPQVAEFNWIWRKWLSQFRDNFSQGEWTPTVQDDSLSDGESQAYTSQEGYWSRIGDRVFIEGEVTMSSLGTLTTSEAVRISGLPFLVASSTLSIGAISIVHYTGLAVTAGYIPIFQATKDTDHLLVRLTDGAAAASDLLLSELSADGHLRFGGHYRAA